MQRCAGTLMARVDRRVSSAGADSIVSRRRGRKIVALLEAGQAAEAAGDPTSAIRFFRSVLKMEPQRVILRLAVGDQYLSLGQRARAEREFRRALELAATREESALSLFSLASSLEGRKREAEAIGYLRRALALEPDNDEFHYLIAGFYSTAGKRAVAEKHFRRAIDLDPKCPHYFCGLADLLLGNSAAKIMFDARKGGESEGLILLRRAARIKPPDRRSCLKFAVQLEIVGRSAEAGREYRSVLRRWPNASITHWAYGTFLVSQGKSARGEQYLRAAVDLNPSDGAALYFLGTHLARTGRRSEASKYFRRASARGDAKAARRLRQLKTGTKAR
jgi:tetratricopeptide (TPR) repeat protein